MPENTLFSRRTSSELDDLFSIGHSVWCSEDFAEIVRNWNGSLSAEEEGVRNDYTKVRSAWNSSSLLFYFRSSFDQLYTDPKLGKGGPINELWEVDVVELFLQPGDRQDYYEYEISPLGQWLDIHILEPRVKVDFDWVSEMQTIVELDQPGGLWHAFLRVPFRPLGSTSSPAPEIQAGDVWRLNLFRLSGKEPSRKYLSWRPTFTDMPEFHVPAAFGNLIFLD